MVKWEVPNNFRIFTKGWEYYTYKYSPLFLSFGIGIVWRQCGELIGCALHCGAHFLLSI